MGKKKEDDDGVPFYLLLTSGMHHGDRNLAASYLRWGDRNLAGDKGLWSPPCRQKLTVSKIANDLGHARTWNLRGKKEYDERVPFYLLLVPRCIMVAGISWRRRRWWFAQNRLVDCDSAGCRVHGGDAGSG